MVTLTNIIVWTSFFISLYLVIFWLLVYFEEGVLISKKRIKKKTYPSVTIAIPVFNEEKRGGLLKTLNSVFNLNYPKELLEIIVVNDGSTDRSEDIIKKAIKENPEFHIIYLKQKNSGKGAALNKALGRSKGEFFTCLDADSYIEADALVKMIPHFDDQNVAVVLPLMKIQNPKRVLEKLQWVEYLLNFFYKSLMSIINSVHVAPGPFSVYRKSVLDKVDGFAVNNLTEDMEVSLKIQKQNYKLLQLLNVEVYTNAPESLKGFYKQRNRWYKGTMFNLYDYRNMMFNKKYGDFGVMQLPRVFLSGVLAVIFLSFTLYRFVWKPLSKRVINLNEINFDVLVLLRRLSFDINWVEINYTNLFFGVVSLVLAIMMLRLAHRYTKEKAFRYGLIGIPAYIVLYGLMTSLVWVGVLFEMIMRKKQKW